MKASQLSHGFVGQEFQIIRLKTKQKYDAFCVTTSNQMLKSTDRNQASVLVDLSHETHTHTVLYIFQSMKEEVCRWQSHIH